MRGHCLCTAVRFLLSAPLPNLYACHCSLCRRQSGTFSNTATLVPSASFAWDAGEGLITKWHKPSGMTSHFCAVCGSPVPNPFRDYFWIPAGPVDAPKAKVVAHICVDDKADGDETVRGGKCYGGMPEDLERFVKMLNGEGEG